MSSTLVGPEVQAPPELDGGGGSDFIDRGSGGGGGGRNESTWPRYDTYQTAVWVLMVPIVMLFIGLTSALIVRKGISDDWVTIQLPGILWVNTLFLLASSASLEAARRSLHEHSVDRLRKRLLLTSALGSAFLLGQLLAWRQLAAQGAFLATNPSSSFFYVLTATHGLHLVGGITALLYLTLRVVQGQFGKRRQSALRATAVYWHFMDALWIYLLFLLIYWR